MNVVELEKVAKQLERLCTEFYLYGRPQREIAKDLNKDPSAVVRQLKEAREHGVVSFDVDWSFGISGPVDAAQSRRLRDEFRLNDAIVVQVEVADPESHQEDDTLHKALANTLAVKVKERIEPADHVALGGGRSVYQAVRAVARQRPLRREVRITPLSGRIWSHAWFTHGGLNIGRPMDPDDAGYRLYLAFENEPDTSFHVVGYPLYVGSRDEAASIMSERNCPFRPDGSWGDWGPPRIALVGAGSADRRSGHRIADLYRGEQLPAIEPYLSRAAGELKDLLEFVQCRQLPFFGDLVNRLFATVPLPNQVKPGALQDYTEAYGQLLSGISALNDRTVVVNWKHLRGIGVVICIAGGAFKLEALWTLLITGYLDRSKRIITELCTDSQTATRLLQALTDYHSAPQETQSWYSQMAARIFT